ESSMALLAACALGDSPVMISTALSRAAFNVPQVSYASRAPRSSPPRFIGNGEDNSKYWRASAMAVYSTNRIYKGNERRCRRQGCDRLMASPARIARDPRPLEGGDQSTLSMVSATGACESVATSTGADSRSPACGIALPVLLIRAATLTL